MLDESQQFETIWSEGIFVDNAIENGNGINLCAIDMFFIEIVYDGKENKIIEVRCFKEGHRLDKYSPKFKTIF